MPSDEERANLAPAPHPDEERAHTLCCGRLGERVHRPGAHGGHHGGRECDRGLHVCGQVARDGRALRAPHGQVLALLLPAAAPGGAPLPCVTGSLSCMRQLGRGAYRRRRRAPARGSWWADAPVQPPGVSSLPARGCGRSPGPQAARAHVTRARMLTVPAGKAPAGRARRSSLSRDSSGARFGR